MTRQLFSDYEDGGPKSRSIETAITVFYSLLHYSHTDDLELLLLCLSAEVSNFSFMLPTCIHGPPLGARVTLPNIVSLSLKFCTLLLRRGSLLLNSSFSLRRL